MRRQQTRKRDYFARGLPGLATVLVFMPMTACPAPKTDVVEMVNGDRITCEIKTLEHNQLKVSTYHMGTIFIEWDKVARVRSTQDLLVERADGARFHGQLVEGDAPETLVVNAGGSRPVQSLDTNAVVSIAPLAGGQFIDRLDGYVSAGLDIAKANDQRTFNFAGGLSSRTRIRELSIDASANVTNTANAERTERYDLQGIGKRFLHDRDFYLGMLKVSRNTELDLDLRALLGGTFGRYFVRNNHFEWTGHAGLALSHEKYTSDVTVESVEAVLATDFSIFRYDFPNTDIGGSLNVLPSLTESGRYRAEATLNAKYEFVRDLYFELQLYGSYDSEPPMTGAAVSDYGLVTSLGYSF